MTRATGAELLERWRAELREQVALLHPRRAAASAARPSATGTARSRRGRRARRGGVGARCWGACGPTRAVATSELARTARQRRADALVTALRQAADGGGVEPTVSGGGGPTVNVLIDDETLAQALDDAATGQVHPDRGSRDPVRRRCVTDRGFLLDPLDVLAALWAGHVRRVVLDGAGAGHRPRTSAAGVHRERQRGGVAPRPHLLVAGLRGRAHPGRSRHAVDRGGLANPANGDALCGWHNRWTSVQDDRTWRDAEGHWHVARPDGTELDPV